MKFNDITGGSEVISQEQKDRMYRQFVADSSRDYTDNLAVAMGQWDEATERGLRGNKPRRQRGTLSPAVAAGILLLLGLFFALLIHGFAHPDIANFPPTGALGSAEAVDHIGLEAEYRNGFTEREAQAAAEGILARFPDQFRDCSLTALSLASAGNLTADELRFTGEMTAGQYRAVDLGVTEPYQSYRVTWIMYHNGTDWMVTSLECVRAG